MGWRHLSEVELTEYADGALPAPKVAWVEEHLRTCSSCAEALARAHAAVMALDHLDPVSPPEDLRRRVAARGASQPVPEIACPQAAALIHDHIDGFLPPALAGALHRHLRACLRCRAEFVALSAAVRLVRSLTAVPAPARVRRAVEAAGRAGPRWAPRGLRLRPALAAAAVAAVGALVLLARPAPERRDLSGRVTVARHSPSAALSRPAEEPAEPASRPPVAVAEAEVAHDMTDFDASSASEPAEARRPPARARERKAAVRSAKGPSAEITATETSAPQVALPAAMRALKAVAKSAAYERDAQHALVLAGERFTTLSSESMLARLPDLGAARPQDRRGRAADKPGTSTLPPAEQPEGSEPGERTSGASPGRAALSSITPMV